MAASSETPISVEARRLESREHSKIAYTIATLVTQPDQYDAMRASFTAGGFSTHDCEYLYIDNTGETQSSAFQGLNQALVEARGRNVILCHQDVRLIPGGDARADLDARLAELETSDPAWALAGNAGGIGPGRLALRISDPHGCNRQIGDLPAQVTSLDENFIVLKRNANLSFSNDLEGFHFYGTDICLIADILGFSAYVIDFHIEHLSPGNSRSQDFAFAKEAFRSKWAAALRARWIQTTCALVRIDGAPLQQIVGHLLEEPVRKLTRRMPGASGWNPSRSTAKQPSNTHKVSQTGSSNVSGNGPGNGEAA